MAHLISNLPLEFVFVRVHSWFPSEFLRPRGRRKRVFPIVILSAAKVPSEATGLDHPAGFSFLSKRRRDPIGFFAPLPMNSNGLSMCWAELEAEFGGAFFEVA